MLKSEKITLRAIEPRDLNILFNWENDTKYWVLSNTLVPFSKNVLSKYLENAHLDIYEAKQLRLVIQTTEDAKPIGLIDLFEFDPFHLRAGVGILIGNDRDHGKGYGSESLRLLVEYSFTHLQLKQLYCNITSDNSGSIHLFEKAGFQKIGTKKAWLKTSQGWKDEISYQLVNPNFEMNF
ncbi:MAG: GNAT family protein [Bacteroidetes bacterium]|nr:GNAT family protein [Bacteroidota bacterium]